MWSVCSCFLNCSQLLSFFALSHTPWLGPWCLRKYLTAESGSLAALLCRGLCCLVECSVVLIAVGWTDEECVCEWVGGRMRCSATLQCCVGCSIQPSSHIHLCLSPFQPPTYSFSPSWPTPPPILVAPWLQVSNTAPACFLWGEGGREGGREPCLSADTRSCGLGWGTAAAGSSLGGTHSASRRKEFGREVSHMIVIHPALLKCGRRARKGFECQHWEQRHSRSNITFFL